MELDNLTLSLNQRGYALLPSLLTPEECKQLIDMYDEDHRYRNIIDMHRYRFGRGEYKYFQYPLPEIIQRLRTEIYPVLSAIANQWSDYLKSGITYPHVHSEFLKQCVSANQVRPTPLILRYQAGGYNTLHQDIYGEVYFPFQVVIMLSEVGIDYKGGEFVMTEQIPRAQSKANVLQPRLGDAVVFTTQARPIKGTHGFYRANMKHGISEVTSGTRYALGIIFHDAA